MMEKERQILLSTLPAVGELMNHPLLRVDATPSSAPPRWAVLEAARLEVARARDRILAEGTPPPNLEVFVDHIRSRATALAAPRLHRVINATGVVIHTNLGRAPLSGEAIARVHEVARGYVNLEYDLEAGGRGSRFGVVEGALCRLTGADAAMVVNNNAAAVLLALSAMAAGREVVVSRGELVEIGGSFRIPDILRQSGARLVEVGATNRTRLADYEEAIGEETALLLKVHPSNFQMLGFTENVSTAALVALGRRRAVAVIEDLGSGCLTDLGPYGLTGEPSAIEVVATGVALVTMSGDKLLGGPQAGILLGSKEVIGACRKHPLARAVRIDKLGLAALEGTLRAYLAGRELEEVPVLAMLSRSPEAIRDEAEVLAGRIRSAAPSLEVRLVGDSSRVGGGSFPERALPTTVLEIRCGAGPQGLEAWLRRSDPPVIAMRRREALVIDPRTLMVGDSELLITSLRAYELRAGQKEG